VPRRVLGQPQCCLLFGLPSSLEQKRGSEGMDDSAQHEVQDAAVSRAAHRCLESVRSFTGRTSVQTREHKVKVFSYSNNLESSMTLLLVTRRF